MNRLEAIERLAADSEGGLTVVDPFDGWPSRVRIQGDGSPLESSVYLGVIGKSHRERDDHKRQFQNPGAAKRTGLSGSTVPLFLGIWPRLLLSSWGRRLQEGEDGRPDSRSSFLSTCSYGREPLAGNAINPLPERRSMHSGPLESRTTGRKPKPVSSLKEAS